MRKEIIDRTSGVGPQTSDFRPQTSHWRADQVEQRSKV